MWSVAKPARNRKYIRKVVHKKDLRQESARDRPGLLVEPLSRGSASKRSNTSGDNSMEVQPDFRERLASFYEHEAPASSRARHRSRTASFPALEPAFPPY